MFDSKTDVLLKGALDGLAARHKAFVQNVANVETPGYKPSDVLFEDQLRRISDAMDGRFTLGPESQELNLALTPDNQNSDRPDDNGVQIDTQIMRMEENSMTYEAVTQAAASRNEILRSAINEGRK